jgi:hypothetical protein
MRIRLAALLAIGLLGLSCQARNLYPFKPYFSYGLNFNLRSPLTGYIKPGAEYYSAASQRNYFVTDASASIQKLGFGAGVFFMVEYKKLWARLSLNAKFANNRTLRFLFPHYYQPGVGVVGEEHILKNINNTNIEIPLEVGYYVNHSQRVKFFVSGGINPIFQLYSKYNFKYVAPTYNNGDYISYDRSLINLATTNFFQMKAIAALGVKWRYLAIEVKYYIPLIELYPLKSPLYRPMQLAEINFMTDLGYFKKHQRKARHD